MWFCGKQIFTLEGKLLGDFKNEKTKVVLKLTRSGSRPPARVMGEEYRKTLMIYAYRRQEENDEDNHLGSEWADGGQLKRQFQGLNNIKWKPK